MSRFNDFDAAVNSNVRPEFTIGGQKFVARAKLPWKKFSSLILSMNEADSSSVEGIAKTENFFRLVLIPKDRQRFIDLINADGEDDDNDENYLDSSQVSALIDWLLELYTGKDEKNDNSSSDTPSTTGVPSNIVSLTPRPTPEAS